MAIPNGYRNCPGADPNDPQLKTKSGGPFASTPGTAPRVAIETRTSTKRRLAVPKVATMRRTSVRGGAQNNQVDWIGSAAQQEYLPHAVPDNKGRAALPPCVSGRRMRKMRRFPREVPNQESGSTMELRLLESPLPEPMIRGV